MPGVIVDIGTGDGEFVYILAKQHPDRFIIGIDPNHAGLVHVSSRIARKPEKGGVENALFVLGRIEELSRELEGTANQVFVNFPWGTLLRGIILVEDPVWDSIKRLCLPGAFVDILTGYEPGNEKAEFTALGVPWIDMTYLTGIMVPKLEYKGFKLAHIENVGKNDLKEYPSSWGKKLGYGRDRTFFHLRLESV